MIVRETGGWRGREHREAKKKGGEENDREAKIIIVTITIKKNIFTT